jgi:tRNA(Ile)-lysidine synthase
LPSSLVQKILSHIKTHQMVAAGSRVGVAVSGGADSVVLLHILHSLATELNCELQVLHVNHRLRGDESEQDEVFVRELAGKLKLPVAVRLAAPLSGNLEQEARDARRAFFQSAIQEFDLQRIALGHTRSDQAETVLFRLLRGAGLTGLAGMQPVTATHLIRPLLHCSREDVRAWATENSVVWRDDSSNTDTRFTRNRLRLETIPQLAQTYSANIEGLLSQTANLAQTEEGYWKGEIERLWATLAQTTRLGIQFPLADLNSLHLAVRRRLIRYTIQNLKGDLRGIEYDHIEAILALCKSEEGHDRVIVPGIDALRSFGQILISHQGLRAAQERDYRIDLKVGGEFTTRLPVWLC